MGREGEGWSLTLGSRGVLAILLAAGLALRLFIAYVAFPKSGFAPDLASFTSWALGMAEVGPAAFYESARFADYPPGYLYVLWVLGLAAPSLAGLLQTNPGDAIWQVMKLPPIAIDLLVAFLLYRLARSWLAERRNREPLALAAAALYLFDPVTWYDSALWGQVDAVGALLVLVTVALLADGHSEGSAATATLAGLIKPQFGVVLLPMVAVVLLRRHLFRVGSGPVPQRAVPRVWRGWLQEEQGPWRLVSAAAVGLLVILVVVSPFSLDLPRFLGRMAATAGGYPYLSVNAYNPWALIGSGGQAALAEGGGWSNDRIPLLGSLSGVALGSLLLGAGFLVGLLQLARRDDRWSILVVAAYLSLCFFVLPTRVHERYLFPTFGVLPLLAVADRRWLVATLVLSLASFINLHAILTVPDYATQRLEDLPLGPTFRTFPFVLFSALGHTAVFLFALWRLRPAVDPLERALRWLLGRPAPVKHIDGGRDLVGPGASARGVLDGLRERLAAPPVRRDLSASLAAEGPGRLARLDLLIVGLVILSTLTLRTWRLEQPYDMHFDEVYHARTATEFLQDWRYGMPHSIYEFTHPHLAKYLIAAGLVAFGNDRVTGESELGRPVTGAAIEERWSPPEEPSRRGGDRLYTLSGSAVEVYDLETRDPVTTIGTPATAAAVDGEGHVLYMADAGGVIRSLDTTALDGARRGVEVVPEPRTIADVGGRVQQLVVAAGGAQLVALVEDDRLVSVDPANGNVTGRATLVGAADAVAVDAGDAVVAQRAMLTDPVAVARRLAEALKGDERRIRGALQGSGEQVAVTLYPAEEQVSAVREAIAAGELQGVDVRPVRSVAVAHRGGVTLLDARDLGPQAAVALSAPATGLAHVTGIDTPTLYVATGRQLELVELPKDRGPTLKGKVPMPNAVRRVSYDPATRLVHALGRTPDGAASTIYVVEPHANAVFADARLPFEPAAWVLDAQPERPSADRQQYLALAGDGRIAAVDAGRHAFAWRMPGVVAGALTAALIYLLGRFLFRRRSVALIAALLVLVDGMFFVNSRIAMNDSYVTLFIVAAYTLFAPLYLGSWRGRWALLLGIPAVGVLLGLALASKWVGAYAIGGAVLLVLVRSALGRLLALAGLVALTSVLVHIAMSGPPSGEVERNFLFLLVMIGLTVATALLMALRPIRFTRQESRFATVASAIGGASLAAAGLAFGSRLPPDGLLTARNLLLAAVALLLLAAVPYALPRVARQIREQSEDAPGDESLGEASPDARAAEAAPAPAPGWLRPGRLGGLPWLYGLGALTIVPLAVYLASYIPWIDLGNHWDLPLVGSRGPGQGFLALQGAMYDYHNELRAAHAASSPWWAWPLDLKPVWFYQESFANGTTALIYDSGNLVIFWLALPALAWAAWQAWRRRSVPLAFVLVAFACLWLPWSRIDRATFQYHVFTSLPFSFLALAYFLAELWHGPSRRTWALARVAAAAALVGAPLLWLGRAPLCLLANVEKVNPGSRACGDVAAQVVISERIGMSLLILVVGGLAVAWQLRSLAALRQRTAQPEGSPSASPRTPGLLWLLLSVAAVGAALVLAGSRFTERPLLSLPLGMIGPYLIAATALVLLGLPALAVLGARDSRRFVVGALGAAAVWFVLWYPNLAALPLPNVIAGAYLGALPTYNYDFQFAVNKTEPFPVSLPAHELLQLMAMLALTVAAASYAGHAWRTELAARRSAAVEGSATSETGVTGSATPG